MDETLLTTAAECTLTVTASHLTTTILQLHYTVYNRSTTSLYLCSQLGDLPGVTTHEPHRQPDPVHIQVELGEINLDKSVMDLSFRGDLKALDIPLLFELPAGGQISQTINLTLPLQPYRVDGRRPGQSGPVLLPMRFTIGYFRSTPNLLAALEPVSNQLHQLITPTAGQLEAVTVGPFSELVAVVNIEPTTTIPVATNPEHWTPWS